MEDCANTFANIAMRIDGMHPLDQVNYFTNGLRQDLIAKIFSMELKSLNTAITAALGYEIAERQTTNSATATVVPMDVNATQTQSNIGKRQT